MEIIGQSHGGYIAALTKEEMRLLTGVDEPYHSAHAHKAGTIVNVRDLSRHIANMDYTATQRKNAAEALRAAATVIESTPEAFVAPAPPEVPPHTEASIVTPTIP